MDDPPDRRADRQGQRTCICVSETCVALLIHISDLADFWIVRGKALRKLGIGNILANRRAVRPNLIWFLSRMRRSEAAQDRTPQTGAARRCDENTRYNGKQVVCQ